MKLNIGCGTDYREGFVNIDGSSKLSRVDRIIDISRESLLAHLPEGEADFILANDIIEHHHHWEARRILQEFYQLLRVGGAAEIRVPDAQFIIRTCLIGIERKLVLLFGGQDLPQGIDAEMDESRKVHPEYFCHKFGWTRKMMERELRGVGFSKVRTKRARTNFIAYATK